MPQRSITKSQGKEQTQQQRQAQIKELQQLYRLTELGQLGVVLLHELANNLTALTLELEDLAHTEHAQAIGRARRITYYLDSIVNNARERLNGQTQVKPFNIGQTLTSTMTFLNDKAEKAQVRLKWQPPPSPAWLTGDQISLGQVVATITGNAIEASKKIALKERIVSIGLEQTPTSYVIRIGNRGKKIPPLQRKQLFAPFYSTKKSGMGLGLFIAKQTIEAQFGGTITINPKSDHTEFVIRLPFKK